MLRRRRRFAHLLRLEDRITPTYALVGPNTEADLALFQQLGGDAWQVTSRTSVGVIAVANVDRVTALLRPAPMEFTAGKPRVVVVPRPEGGFERFEIWQSTIMEPGLAAQFPTIKTYRGQSLDRPATQMAADVGPNGFHATVVGPGVQWSIAPVALGDVNYRIEKLSGPLHGGGCSCGVCQLAAPAATDAPPSSLARYSSGPTLRTFRFAVAATGEYYAFSGGTLAGTQANIVTVVNTVNLLFERDFTIRLVLVANNSDLIFSNAATDPYTGDNAFAMLDQNQLTVDSKIGLPNYDLGFVFSAGSFGGGVAYLRGIQAAWRASGAAIAPMFGTPTGSEFSENVAHEIGHQLGALHSFNGVNGAANGNRVAQTAVEVGSGSSIMAYPGISGADDLQSFPDLYYHSISYDQVRDFIDSLDPSIGGKITTGNAAPTVFAGLDAAIPANTPFALTAVGSDPNGDAITYSWEERDVGPAQALGSADNGRSPIFRAFAPVSDGTRTFPNLTNLLANTASKGEQLPSTNRTLDYRVLVRDNKLSGGGVNGDDLSLTVVNTGSPFKVTSPNTAVSLPAGSSQVITWDVAGTTAAPISVATVNIRLSIDGGLTWPYFLASKTANDGSEPVDLQAIGITTNARIRVEAVNNYFFDVSDTTFSIADSGGSAVTTTFSFSTNATASFQFPEAVDAATLSPSDLEMTAGSVTSVTVVQSTIARFGLNLNHEGPLTFTLPANAISGISGKGNLQVISTFFTDIQTGSLSMPLTAFNPVGSLVYSDTKAGEIFPIDDKDAYTIDLDAGQSLSAKIEPSSNFRPVVRITGPNGFDLIEVSSAKGNPVTITTASLPTAGTYTVSTYANDNTGTYILTVDLNSTLEIEPNNLMVSASQFGTTTVLGSGAARSSARGRTDAFTNFRTREGEDNGSIAMATDVSFSFLPYSGNLYQMGIAANFDFSDWWNIGQLQPGDFLTYATYGTASGRGTLTDPGAYVYYGPNGFYAAGDNDSGNGLDSLLHRWGPDYAESFYVTGYGSGSFGQTYQIGLLLENADAAPLTGAAEPPDTEPNNGPTEAVNAASSWRPVQFRSNTAGSIGFLGPTESDFFKYQFNAGDLVSFIGDSTSDADLQLYLKDSAGTVVASDDGSNAGLSQDEDATIYAFRVPMTGTYYVEVKSKGATGSYQLVGLLSASVAPPTPTATPDYFAFSASAGAFNTVAIKAQTVGNLTVELVDGAGTVLAMGSSGTTNFDRVLSYTSPSNVPLYVRVQGDPGIDYLVTLTTGATVDLEPNDAFAAAQALVNNTAIGAVVANNEDWYSLTLNAGNTIVATTATPGGGTGQFVNTLDPLLELYSPSNVLLASDDNSVVDGRNARLFGTATVAGTYRVRVRGAAGSSGEYVLAAAVDPPAKVASVVVNGGAVQRSRVTEVTVSFNEVVTLPGTPVAAFQLLRQGGTPADTVTLTVDTTASSPLQTIAKLTFSGGFTNSGSLADGKFTLTVLSSQVTDLAGQALDGDANGTSGGDYVLVGHPATNKLYRLFGDADGDNDVDNTDFVAFRTAFGTGATIFDFDNDADTDNADFVAFRARFGTMIP